MIYTIYDAGVLRFLHQHPDLLEVLAEALPHLEELFAPVSVVLRMGTFDEKLWGYIQTALPEDVAIKHLRELDDIWFLRQAGRTKDLFNFNLRCL